MGYELHTAVSDLIDNSVFAGAKTVSIKYSWNSGRPWVMIIDDGAGMTEAELRRAMKPGSRSPSEQRAKDDLGRFGLGLKTASWSQCKLVTVMTKTASQPPSHRQWDLDYVVENDKWALQQDIARETEEKLRAELDSLASGTVVLWQALDRLTGIHAGDGGTAGSLRSTFNEKFSETLLPHLGMTFHRFLTGPKGIKLSVGAAVCKPWDPFLTAHKVTEQRETEQFDSGAIQVTPFILPHASHLTETELAEAQGPWGWSSQQGFYVYRNRRMIISGGYLGLTDSDGRHFEERDHYRLCRIRVDLPNDVDHEWEIDVRKALASPPLRLRRDFERLARSTREKSSQVYRRRTVARSRPKASTAQRADIWHSKKVGAKTVYKVNRSSPAIEHIRSTAGLPRKYLDALLHLIERTVPYRGITVDNNEVTDATVDLPDSLVEPPEALVDLAVEFVRDEIARGKTNSIAVDYVCRVVFSLDSPQLRVALEKEFLNA